MAKELPYFKFEPSEWDNGNVQMCSDIAKVHFINMCSAYWSRLGSLSDKFALIKCCSGNSESFNELVESRVIKVKNGNISIKFLDLQLTQFKDDKECKAASGRKGGVNNGVRPDCERVSGKQLYCIICRGNGEVFLKIGTTINTVSRRYSGKMPYEYEVAFQVFTEDYIKLEDNICEMLSGCEYIPRLNFAGQKECYQLQHYQTIIDYVDHFAEATLKRNEAIRVDKIRKDKIKEENNIPPNPLKGESDSTKKNEVVGFEKKEKAKSTPRVKFEPDYSGMEPEVEQAFREFNEFRRTKRKAWGSQLEFERFVEKLRKLSNGSFNTAREILSESIANGWTGIFELKTNQKNGKPKESSDEYKRTVVNIAANAIAGAEKSRLEREERERRIRESSPGY